MIDDPWPEMVQVALVAQFMQLALVSPLVLCCLHLKLQQLVCVVAVIMMMAETQTHAVVEAVVAMHPVQSCEQLPWLLASS